MKTAVVLLFSFATFALAQDGEAIQAKRMKSVTWDLQNKTLTWTVENGVAQNGQFVPSSEERYEISPSGQSMSFGDQSRGFSEEESVWVQHLLDVLTMYCAQSVVWWMHGDGEPLNGAGATSQPKDKPADQPDSTPVSVKIRYQPPARSLGAPRLVSRKMIY